MKLNIVNDTANLQMECVTFVTSEQVDADSLDMFYFLEQFNKTNSKVIKEIVWNKKLKILDLCGEIKLFSENRNIFGVKSLLEFANNLPKAIKILAFLNRNNLFIKNLVIKNPVQSGQFSEQGSINKIKKLDKIPIPTTVVRSFLYL